MGEARLGEKCDTISQALQGGTRGYVGMGNGVLYPLKTCPASMSPGLLRIQDIAGGEQILFFLGFMLGVGGKRKTGSSTQICSARMVHLLKQRPGQ